MIYPNPQARNTHAHNTFGCRLTFSVFLLSPLSGTISKSTHQHRRACHKNEINQSDAIKVKSRSRQRNVQQAGRRITGSSSLFLCRAVVVQKDARQIGEARIFHCLKLLHARNHRCRDDPVARAGNHQLQERGDGADHGLFVATAQAPNDQVDGRAVAQNKVTVFSVRGQVAQSPQAKLDNLSV